MKFVLHPENSYKFSSQHLKGFGCINPERHIEIHSSGDITVCCYSWLAEFCGNFLTDSFEEVLNNANRLRLIEGMKRGEFTECNDHCPILSAMLKGEEHDKPIVVPLEKYNETVKSFPYVIQFSYDESCNLQCPSCRNEFKYFSVGENKTLDAIHSKAKQLIQYLFDTNQKVLLNITGSGDAFASPTFWSYLKELSQMQLPDDFQLMLMTNGILMTRERWEEIKPLWKHIVRILVSIDAYSQETYSYVRKNGFISKVGDNCKTLNEKIGNGDFPRLSGWQVNYTVQKRNYKEVKDFATWQLGFDNLTTIFYSMVSRWGHMTDSQYNNMILDIEDKSMLKEILKDDIFRDKRIVLGSLGALFNDENKNQ